MSVALGDLPHVMRALYLPSHRGGFRRILLKCYPIYMTYCLITDKMCVNSRWKQPTILSKKRTIHDVNKYIYNQNMLTHVTFANEFCKLRIVFCRLFANVIHVPGTWIVVPLQLWNVDCCTIFVIPSVWLSL